MLTSTRARRYAIAVGRAVSTQPFARPPLDRDEVEGTNGPRCINSQVFYIGCMWARYLCTNVVKQTCGLSSMALGTFTRSEPRAPGWDGQMVMTSCRLRQGGKKTKRGTLEGPRKACLSEPLLLLAVTGGPRVCEENKAVVKAPLGLDTTSNGSNGDVGYYEACLASWGKKAQAGESLQSGRRQCLENRLRPV
jgi:hypothetical protein